MADQEVLNSIPQDDNTPANIQAANGPGGRISKAEALRRILARFGINLDQNPTAADVISAIINDEVLEERIVTSTSNFQ